MAQVDRFTLEQFKSALPVNKKDGNKPLFMHLGLVNSEHCFAWTLMNQKIRILVRSSIDGTGIAKDTGEDSIRIVIERLYENSGKWVPIGKGNDAYTQRIPGWEKRLWAKLDTVFQKARKIRLPFDDEDTIRFVKVGVNVGRPFALRKEATGQLTFHRWLDTTVSGEKR